MTRAERVTPEDIEAAAAHLENPQPVEDAELYRTLVRVARWLRATSEARERKAANARIARR